MTFTRPENLQHWMVEVITHTGSIEAALASPAAAALVEPSRIGELVRPTEELTSAERLGIYHGMYLLRMEEALSSDYPALRRRLGARRFADLVAAYVAAHPSSSYTLNRLGDALPAFLATRATSPAREALAELARLEQGITEAFDADESPTLAASTLSNLPPETWGACRFVPQAALRLVCTRHDVGEQLDALHAGRPVRAARRRRTHIVLFRRDYEVRRLTVGRAEFRLLEVLCAGATLGDALTHVPERHADQVFAWFQSWLAGGVFSSVASDDP